jgi:hypothetical protein
MVPPSGGRPVAHSALVASNPVQTHRREAAARAAELARCRGHQCAVPAGGLIPARAANLTLPRNGTGARLRNRSLLRQARSQSASPGRCGTPRKPSEGWMRSRRLPRNGRSSRPPGRVVTTWDRARWALIRWIAVMHERIRQFEAGESAKPVLRQFIFDENRGREVARRGGGWRGRSGNWRRPASGPPRLRAKPRGSRPVNGAGRRQCEPNARGDRPAPGRNVTDPDSRLMQDTDGGHRQGCSAQPASAGMA